MKKLSWKLSVSLCVTSLSLLGCGSQVPAFPEVDQCAYVSGFFYCVNTKTGAEVKLPASIQSMRGAQCMSLDDYRKSEQWVASVKQIAEKRCR